MARPPTYHSDDERPITVSVRIPRELYHQAKAYAVQRRTTITELLLDGLRLRLETPTDPRDIVVAQDTTGYCWPTPYLVLNSLIYSSRNID